MAVMNTTLKDATGSFGLSDAAAMVRKASREYQRFSQAQNDEDRRDSAINCAMTLWHLCDWSWAGVAAYGRFDVELMDLLGVKGRRPEDSDLVAWALRCCPALEICQSICNGSKHVRSDRPVITDMIEIASANRLVVRDSDGDKDVGPILLDALSFWVNQATNESKMR